MRRLMTKFTSVLATMALAASLTGAVRADDANATAVVEKAIKALGGEEKLRKAATATWKAKGTIVISGTDSDMATQTTIQGLDHFRQEFEGTFGENKVQGVSVLAGDKA